MILVVSDATCELHAVAGGLGWGTGAFAMLF